MGQAEPCLRELDYILAEQLLKAGISWAVTSYAYGGLF